jgi:nicotinamide riboside transporter PnuC
MVKTKTNYLKYFNVWLLWTIVTSIMTVEAGFSNACPEWKVLYLLLGLILVMFSYKFWCDKVEAI